MSMRVLPGGVLRRSPVKNTKVSVQHNQGSDGNYFADFSDNCLGTDLDDWLVNQFNNFDPLENFCDQEASYCSAGNNATIEMDESSVNCGVDDILEYINSGNDTPKLDNVFCKHFESNYSVHFDHCYAIVHEKRQERNENIEEDCLLVKRPRKEVPESVTINEECPSGSMEIEEVSSYNINDVSSIPQENTNEPSVNLSLEGTATAPEDLSSTSQETAVWDYNKENIWSIPLSRRHRNNTEAMELNKHKKASTSSISVSKADFQGAETSTATPRGRGRPRKSTAQQQILEEVHPMNKRISKKCQSDNSRLTHKQQEKARRDEENNNFQELRKHLLTPKGKRATKILTLNTAIEVVEEGKRTENALAERKKRLLKKWKECEIRLQKLNEFTELIYKT